MLPVIIYRKQVHSNPSIVDLPVLFSMVKSVADCTLVEVAELTLRLGSCFPTPMEKGEVTALVVGKQAHYSIAPNRSPCSLLPPQQNAELSPLLHSGVTRARWDHFIFLLVMELNWWSSNSLKNNPIPQRKVIIQHPQHQTPRKP